MESEFSSFNRSLDIAQIIKNSGADSYLKEEINAQIDYFSYKADQLEKYKSDQPLYLRVYAEIQSKLQELKERSERITSTFDIDKLINDYQSKIKTRDLMLQKINDCKQNVKLAELALSQLDEKISLLNGQTTKNTADAQAIAEKLSSAFSCVDLSAYASFDDKIEGVKSSRSYYKYLV